MIPQSGWRGQRELLVLGVCWLTATCADDRSKFGQPCEADKNCKGGRCHDFRDGIAANRTCTQFCETDDDCPSPETCATAASGERVCAPGCDQDRDGYACEDGARVACAHATKGEHCWYCDDCEVSETCHGPGPADAICVPKFDLGEPCDGDEDCVTANCGTTATSTEPRCLAPLGGPCTTENCGICHHEPGMPEGQRLCTRLCACENSEDPGCGYCPGDMECVGHGEGTNYYCVDRCVSNDDCPPGVDCEWFYGHDEDGQRAIEYACVIG